MNIYKYLIISILIFISVLSPKAQEVVLEKDIEESAYNVETGPDQKVFSYVFYDLGQIIPDKYELPGVSWTYAFGMKVKYKMTRVLNVVNSYQYRRLAYRLDQDVNKTFPDTYTHSKQRYAVHQLGTDLALRVNIGRRGNSIGWFVDMGGYAALNPFTRLKNTDKINNILAGTFKTIARDLKFPVRYEYGLTGRVGYSRYALYANYRLSDMFKSKFNFPELSKLVIGFQLGLQR